MSKIAKDRPRLGRGLSSLISVAETTPVHAAVEHLEIAPVPEVVIPLHAIPTEVPLGLISPNPYQPRKSFSDAGLAELAASLKSTGLIQPIVVRQVENRYQLIAGERRWRAAQLAGLATILVVIRDVDTLTQAQMALVENVQREDLNPIDRASAYQTLLDQLGLTQAELATRLGEERSSIANYLRLLNLSDVVRQHVADGKLTLGHAKILAGVNDRIEQERLATLTIEQGLSVRNLERVAEEPTATRTAPKVTPVSPHVQNVETSLSRQLGMKVQLKASSAKGKGKLVIHYASLDQFDDLVQRLGVRLED